jgi:glycerol kinase
MNVLAIDQGTSSTKALVVGPGGVVLGEGSAPVTPRPGADGTVEQDPGELLQSVIEAGRRALAAAGEDVETVGVGNQGETVLAWDPATGAALGPAISWQDRRAATIVHELAGEAARLGALTGLPLDPYFAAPKQAWLTRRLGRPAAVTTIDAWVTHRLTGAFVTDAATASRTMLMDLGTRSWSPEACTIFGLDAAAQPAILDNACTGLGTTAFGPSLPVTGLCVDQQAALFAQGCLRPGEAKCTYGTGAFILANAGPAPVPSSSGLAACLAWQVAGQPAYCLDGQVYTAGAAIGWLQRVGLLHDLSELDAGAACVPPPVTSPLFVPALAGLAAPHWAPEARAAWLGLSLATERAELIGAVLWGIAAEVALLAGQVAGDLGRPLELLRADGGLTRSRRLMQAQADLLQAPVEVSGQADATALGIAAFARLGLRGEPADAQAVAGALGDVRPSATYEPQISADHAATILDRHGRAARAVVELAGAPA